MKPIYVIISLVMVALFLLFFYFTSFKDNAVQNELPEKFWSYQSIDSLETIKSGGAVMKLLLKSTQEIKHYLMPQNNVIVATVPAKDENCFFKINPAGDIVDSLVIKSPYANVLFLSGFIVEKEAHQYYKWSFNGDKEPLQIVIQNVDLKWDEETQTKQLNEIIKNSKTIYADYKFISPEPREAPTDGRLQTIQAPKSYAVLTYFINDACFQFSTNLNVHKHFPLSYTRAMLLNNLFKQINQERNSNEQIINSPYITYQYYQKLKLEKAVFSGGGGNAPPFTRMLWHGNLFTDVVFKTDTLKLKEFMYLDEEWHDTAIKIDLKNIGSFSKLNKQPGEAIDAYMYYNNPHLHYALFTNNDKKLYIIK